MSNGHMKKGDRLILKAIQIKEEGGTIKDLALFFSECSGISLVEIISHKHSV